MTERKIQALAMAATHFHYISMNRAHSVSCIDKEQETGAIITITSICECQDQSIQSLMGVKTKTKTKTYMGSDKLLAPSPSMNQSCKKAATTCK